MPPPSSVLRVSLTGPESAGKSTLAAQLAAHYGTVFVPEYAREYLAAHGPSYTPADLEAMARAQLAAEDRLALVAHLLLFCDTDLLVMKIWAEEAFGSCPDWITQALARPRYALTLLLAPDLPWQPDPLREHPNPADRRRLYQRYQTELRRLAWPYVDISGPPPQRLAQATAAVDRLLAPLASAPSA